MGYKHKFIQADMLTLKGEDYRGYDVIWGSPPCRDFTPLGRVYGKSWKNKPDPKKGLILIDAFLSFVQKANPKIRIMENVEESKRYIPFKPQAIMYLQRKKNTVFGEIFPCS